MSLITITIEGRARTGKTTVAELINRELTRLGFKVRVVGERKGEHLVDPCADIVKQEATIDICEHHLNDKPNPAVLKLAEELEKRYSMEDLDAHVHELKSREASNINNSSFAEQVQYLVEAGGIEWVKELLK